MLRKFYYVAYFPMAQQSLEGQGLLISELHDHTQSDTPHLVGLLWTNDQPDAETSTWQYTTLKGERHPCFRGIRTHIPSKRYAQTHALGRTATGISM
jgi:hypothetical protein